MLGGLGGFSHCLYRYEVGVVVGISEGKERGYLGSC